MIHHVSGSYHYAHSFGCMQGGEVCENWRILPEGDDGRCAWCRESDKRWEDRKAKAWTPF